MRQIDIIIPVLNERNNLRSLFARIDKSLKDNKILYNLIVIDDHSTDGTSEILKDLSKVYPVTYKLKQGKPGKAYSILEGSNYAKSENIVMIDADLQYPPESIPEMLQKMENDSNIGMVIGERILKTDLSAFRRLVSKVSRFVNGKLIMGLDFDVQSGLKLFKKEAISNITTEEVYPWAIDIPLINETLEQGYKIETVDIEFAKRNEGKVKINIARATRQIIWGALKVKFKPKKIYTLVSKVENSMIEAGFVYKRKRFVTHSTLNANKSAIKTVVPWQKNTFLSLILLSTIALIAFPKAAAIGIMAVLTVIYFADVLFNLYLVFKSLHFPPEISFSKSEIDALKDEDLPVYTILSPLYREGDVFSQFIENIDSLDYPKNKLDVILLLEEDDKESQSYLKTITLPEYFRVLVVPDSQPKTKPKACNYGLNHAKGEYVVIYDAEDRPDADQLKKAYLGFQKMGDNYACLQAKLNYYNPHQNILTRLFTAEYSLWFDVILPALQSIDTTIPLGGTSNHFRTAQLLKLEGWDPFNVTEDADLGVRLFKEGKKTAIIDSITLEEANSNLKNWIRQRSRWLKGYMQTFLVHMRNPISFFKEHKQHFMVFQLIAGLRISFMLINPFMWILTLSYFVLKSYVGEAIESIFPAAVFYMAITSAVFGNFLYIYYYMIGAAKRAQWSIIKYILLIPVYWLFTSIAGFVAFWQLITKPHFWEKTVHGLHLTEKEQKKIRFAFLTQLTDLGFNGVKKAKTYLTPEYVSGAILICATLVNNFFGFLYNAYLSRKLSYEDFGLISLFGSFLYISSIPTSALSRTFTHKSAYLFGKYKGIVREFWTFYRKRLIKISVLTTLVWIISIPFLANIFKAESYFPFIVFTPIWIMTLVGAIDASLITGGLYFTSLSAVMIAEPIVKFVITFILVETGNKDAVYLSIPTSILVAFVFTYYIARSIKGTTKKVDTEVAVSFPSKFFATSFFAKISTIVFISFDLVLARLLLSPEEAGMYSVVSVVGKMIYFLCSLFSQFIIPYVSRENGEGAKNNNAFVKLFSLISLSTGFGVLVFGILSKFTAPFLIGEKANNIVEYLPAFTIAIALFSIASSLTSYNQARKRYIFPIAELSLSLLTVLGLILFHKTIWTFIEVMTIGGIVNLTGITVLHLFYEQISVVISNLKDFVGLFKKEIAQPAPKEDKKLRILIFNWRDTRHVWSGGAEVYIHEIAKRLVTMGHPVTLFCGNDGKSPRNEVVDGVQMIRRGGFYTVFLWAALYYMLRLRFYFDVIIDSENGVPFFTPLYARKKIFLLIHHIHQDVFRMRLRPPFSWIGKFLEKHMMPLVYKNTEIITVSPSSKADILEHKITSKEPYVIYNGVDAEAYVPGKKSKTPLVLYLGRLTPQKSLPVFIHTAKRIINKIPTVKFVIAGDGEEKSKLMRLVTRLGLEEHIEFTGKVTHEEKLKLYQKAWVFVNPSLVEGWGITTIEANACGVPVVASNVAGLRDAVHNPHSGVLVPYGDIEEFSQNIIKLINDKNVRSTMNKEARQWSMKFSWQKSAEQLEELL